MQIRRGTNAEGLLTVQIRLPSDDPRAMLIKALAQRGATSFREMGSGFTFDGPGDESAANELETMLMRMLPEELAREITDAAERGGVTNQVEKMMESFHEGGMEAVMPILGAIMKGGKI